MISDSDSGSDSDDCLVYKTVRPVVWSDEEEEKPKVNAGAGSRRAREEVDDLDEVVCATSASARKRARTARAATTSKADIDVVEIEEEKPPSAADAFLAPPPANARGVVQSVDVATLESVFASRRRMAELRAAAAAPVEAPETIADFPPSVAGDAGGAGEGAGSSPAAVGGKTIAVVFQTPRARGASGRARTRGRFQASWATFSPPRTAGRSGGSWEKRRRCCSTATWWTCPRRRGTWRTWRTGTSWT